jgi:diguanylate cyclase (GGDEF)-like protein/PAS domain S-box-containing protein
VSIRHSEIPNRALLVIVAAVIGGAATLGVALHDLSHTKAPSPNQLEFAVLVGLLALVSWLKPLVIYVDDQSEAIHLDEGFLVMLLVLVQPSLVVVTFAASTALAQVLLKRPFIKSVFNFGQLLISVGIAALVFQQLSPQAWSADYYRVGAAVAAAAVFFVVNNVAVGVVLWAMGMRWKAALLEGLDIRLMIVAGGVGVAIGMALLLDANPTVFPIAILPIVILRYALTGFFRAREDRSRLQGLFEATLEANASMGQEPEGVADGILDSARKLLRCSDAVLSDKQGAEWELQSSLSLPGRQMFLGVAGRSPTEPFDGTDERLLEALAAVGSSALTNAALYQRSRSQEQHLAAITASLGEGVCAVSMSGHVTFANNAAMKMLGLAHGDTVGVPRSEGARWEAVAPDHLLVPVMRAVTTGETTRRYDTNFRRSDGTTIDVACTVAPLAENGAPAGAVVIFRDISEQKQMAELRHQAFHDTLTGLPNRRRFLNDLEDAMRRSAYDGEVSAVLFVDVNRFKLINDSLGHHLGDALLTAIAHRLRAAVRPGDLLARFGGDEFTMLLRDVHGVADAEDIARRILHNLKRPIALPDGRTVFVDLSIGIATTATLDDPDDLLRAADVAMYQAKASSKSGGYCVFDASIMGERSSERIDFESDLRRAVERDEIEVHYQPLVSADDGRILAVEALARWNSPSRGMLLPDKFIGVAEETNVILDVGNVVLTRACEKARFWRDRYGVDLSVGVNLSARQFEDRALVRRISSILDSTGADPSQLCLEITESLAMRSVENTKHVLNRVKGLGAKFALDDFGTGYSTLAHLAEFPIDVVKVDQSFVRGVENSPVKSAIVSAVLNMSEAIHVTAVVEGIETEPQFDHLRLLGCSVGQGYLFGYPMTAGKFEALLDHPGGVARHGGRFDVLAPAGAGTRLLRPA